MPLNMISHPKPDCHGRFNYVQGVDLTYKGITKIYNLRVYARKSVKSVFSSLV